MGVSTADEVTMTSLEKEDEDDADASVLVDNRRPRRLWRSFGDDGATAATRCAMVVTVADTDWSKARAINDNDVDDDVGNVSFRDNIIQVVKTNRLKILSIFTSRQEWPVLLTGRFRMILVADICACNAMGSTGY